jgi:hypothetical protein
MTRWIRRLLVLSLVGGTADLMRRKLKRADEIKPSEYRPFTPVTPPERPASPPAEAAQSDTSDTVSSAASSVAGADETPASLAAPATTGSWQAPNADGSCPDGFPIKANDQSKIFHEPGGRSYDRTIAERCYANADDAKADGYRPAKR